MNKGIILTENGGLDVELEAVHREDDVMDGEEGHCYGFSSFPLIFVYLLRLCFLVPLNRYIFSFPTCIASHCSSQPRV